MINQHSSSFLDNQVQNFSNEGYKYSWFDWFCLWYPPGWLVLFNRHWQHYNSDPDGWNPFEYGLFLIPGGFYLAVLIRWLRLGCRSPREEQSEFNPYYQQAFRQEVLAPIVNKYFRAELKQIENLPASEPLLLIMNHAGMCFPWDFITLAYLLSEKRNWTVRPLTGVALFEHPWIVWWLPRGWSNVLGGVRAEFKAFENAVKERTVILYAPEGLHGPKKGWVKRYQLQNFNISFVQLSQRYQIPILPIICIGNENLHPFAINIRKIQKIFKLPFLPISPLMFLLFLFPSMGVWAMPTRLHYYIQKIESNTQNIEHNHTAAYQKAQIFKDKMQNWLDIFIQGQSKCN
ncbi:MAG: 1-acyl-sn-glycerol-3-phosphate acyltransferase [Calothrix sp. C42_A2020_038]|nr:1-acyl-sn-glycerol-3-phosphate acyltransferase [Calothrix sp. C42_A2020_038]